MSHPLPHPCRAEVPEALLGLESGVFRSLVNYFDSGDLGIRLRFSHAFVWSLYAVIWCGFVVWFWVFFFELQSSWTSPSEHWKRNPPGGPSVPRYQCGSATFWPPITPVKPSPLWPPPHLTPTSAHPAVSLALAEPSQCTHRADGIHDGLATVLFFFYFAPSYKTSQNKPAGSWTCPCRGSARHCSESIPFSPWAPWKQQEAVLIVSLAHPHDKTLPLTCQDLRPSMVLFHPQICLEASCTMPVSAWMPASFPRLFWGNISNISITFGPVPVEDSQRDGCSLPEAMALNKPFLEELPHAQPGAASSSLCCDASLRAHLQI